MFAFVATFIPRNPAKPEATAPIINERAINALESALPEFAKPRTKATATTKTPKMRPAENYVLKPFKKDNDKTLSREIVKNAADAIDSIVFNGLDRTMNIYNS